jgi:hypothetical protein
MTIVGTISYLPERESYDFVASGARSCLATMN